MAIGQSREAVWPKALEARRRIEGWVREHEEWRKGCINLIAAENVHSRQVGQFLDSDLAQRYGDYVGRDLAARKYCGNTFIEKIEEQTIQIVQETFGARYVELRALSGHVAGSAVIAGLTKPGDTVMEVGQDGGGHRLAAKLAKIAFIPLDVKFLPFDPQTYNIAVPAAIAAIREYQPRLVIVGSSNFLFPHPVQELAEVLREFPGTILAYDASHVFGLIAGKAFQSPLDEGAHLVFGSTHKTLPGPQGGLILSNSEEIISRVSAALYPPLVTNHHLARLPALAVALLEMQVWGQEYAAQIVANARALGRELESRGVGVVGAEMGYTRSHTLLLKVAPFGSGAGMAELLERARIITNSTVLPESLGQEGIRLGVQEVTRRGAKEEDMPLLAGLMADVLTRRRPPEKVAEAARAYTERFQTLHYSWSDQLPRESR